MTHEVATWMVRTMSMMAGELDPGDFLNKEKTLGEIGVFLIFVLLVVFLLMNFVVRAFNSHSEMTVS